MRESILGLFAYEADTLLTKLPPPVKHDFGRGKNGHHHTLILGQLCHSHIRTTLTIVTPTKISNTENHKNYHMTDVMCPMGSFKYNYGTWSLGICLDQTP